MARPPYEWTDDDRRALIAAARDLNMRPLDLLAVLHSESGLNPWAVALVNGSPAARGLNQITKIVAYSPKLNLSEAEWEAITSMTAKENLPYVVKSFLSALGSRTYADAGEIYATNFAPAILKSRGGGNDVVLYRAPGRSYTENKNFDTDNKGYITIGDLRRRLYRDTKRSRYLEEAQKLKALDPSIPELVIESSALSGVSQEATKFPWVWAGVTTLAVVAMCGAYGWQAGWFDDRRT